MKVLVSVPVNNFTGFGNDGIELVRALINWGANVFLHPSGVFPPLPRDVAAVLTKPIPSEVDLIISHRCPQELSNPITSGVMVPSTVALAWSMWEWDSLNNVDAIDQNNCEHARKVLDTLEPALRVFDAVLAYDDVSYQALAPFHSHVEILQGGVPLIPEFVRDWHTDPFRFLMAGALSQRKNPFAAIGAFKSLRDKGELKNAELILKTTYTGLHMAMQDWCPGLKIIPSLWPEKKMWELYQSCHVLLAPSWGEGKNIPACQFAMSGGAVALPLIGGHAQWASQEYTFPLAYDWTDYSPGVRGAKVDQKHLAEVMVQLYRDRQEARRRGALASMALPAMVSWPSVLERLQLRLPRLAGTRGAEVAALMRACRKPLVSEVQRDAAVYGALDSVPR